jgi:hypothetical protein
MGFKSIFMLLFKGFCKLYPQRAVMSHNET